MFNSLHKRLTWLYTITTGCILTLVIAVFLMYSVNETKRAQLTQFQTNWNNISSRMKFDSTFSHSWLAQTEADNHMIIHIEENGIPFLYSGSWTPETDRQVMIDRAKNLADTQGVHMAVAPVSSTMNLSSLITLEGDFGDRYYAMVLTLSTDSGVKSLCVISYIPPVSILLKGTFLFLCIMDFLGISGLFVISYKFVGWSLKPVETARKKQAEFIAAASHELRSPLSVLRSGTAAVMAAPEQKETLLRTMDAECVRMSRLISDMLLLASTDARTWSIHMEDTDFDTLLLDTYETFLPSCREKGVELQLELPEESLPIIPADGERIKQVLMILLDNALFYTPSGRSICLSADLAPAKHRRGQLILKVSDQGCGIPDDVKPHIFDRFYRADSARSSKEHFGLGLSIAKELVRLHGGDIEVADQGGGGTCFSITLNL